jgi:hypothetical protein
VTTEIAPRPPSKIIRYATHATPSPVHLNVGIGHLLATRRGFVRRNVAQIHSRIRGFVSTHLLGYLRCFGR